MINSLEKIYSFEAKTRYEFIKEKLNLNLINNDKNLEYLKSKYFEYLPNNFDN